MKKLRSVANIKDPYSRRILGNVVDKDAFNVYCQTPARLQHLLKGMNDRTLRRSPGKGKWTIGQIIAHLADSELVMGFRFRMAMAQPKARLQAFDQNKWDRRLHYDKTDCRRKLDLFVALRRDNIALLRTATVRDWKQYGMHEERGKETLERMVQMDAGHDVNHLRQVRTLRERFLKGPSR